MSDANASAFILGLHHSLLHMFQLIFFAYCIQWCKLYQIISGSHLVTGERELNECFTILLLQTPQWVEEVLLEEC